MGPKENSINGTDGSRERLLSGVFKKADVDHDSFLDLLELQTWINAKVPHSASGIEFLLLAIFS